MPISAKSRDIIVKRIKAHLDAGITDAEEIAREVLKIVDKEIDVKTGNRP